MEQVSRMRTRKWLTRLLLGVAIVLVAVLVTVVVLWRMVRSRPDFYRIVALPREQIEAAAQSATNKFATIQNQAARLRAGSSARNSREGASEAAVPAGGSKNDSAGAPTTSPDSISVTFTDTELNAFFEKWSNFHNWKGSYEQYFADPVVILKDGRIILAGKLKDADLIASLHFEPKITPEGQLDLQLVRILGGSLPLPESLISGYQRKI